ncbi:MAG TPA: DUF881 domain-containing protein [Candidatus Dormibacteraeota bacterium]|nr:DUF881 domain-containing protein [Candidatus Dormibacteraeota bacterium]
MAARVAQVSLALVLLLIGLLVVGQLRSQARPTELSSLSAQDLSTLIETLSDKNRQLRSGLGDVQEQIREYRAAQAQGQSALDVSREDLRRITAFSGQGGVEGQGIVVNVDGDLDAIAVNDLLNELRNAGAEAIVVDAIRVTARSVAVQGTSSLEIDGVAIQPQFEIRAVGDPDGLLTALERPGGIISQLKLFARATITATQEQQISIPATDVNLAPKVAQAAE